MNRAIKEAIDGGLEEYKGDNQVAELCVEARTASVRRRAADQCELAIAMDIGGTRIKMAYRPRGVDELDRLETMETHLAFRMAKNPMGSLEWNNAHAIRVICNSLRRQLARRTTCAPGNSLHQVTRVAISSAGPIASGLDISLKPTT